MSPLDLGHGRVISARSGSARGDIDHTFRPLVQIARAFGSISHAPFRQWSSRLVTALAASFSASALVAYECGDRT
jgi:hypothetical protein